MNIKDMTCPHGWVNCGDCENLRLCMAGLYQSDKSIVEIAAEISEKVVHQEVVESVEMIKRPARAYTDMDRFYGYRVPNLHHKEPNPLDGGIVHGGGSSNKAAKKPLKKVPEYLKTWGT